jgi:hypothetical protein
VLNRPPLMLETEPLAVFCSPPLTLAAMPLAVLPLPSLMLETAPLARLLDPPLMLAKCAPAVLSWPPLTQAPRSTNCVSFSYDETLESRRRECMIAPQPHRLWRKANTCRSVSVLASAPVSRRAFLLNCGDHGKRRKS